MSHGDDWADNDFEIPDDHPIAGGFELPGATVRPPLVIMDDDEEEEGVSTIKVDQATLRQSQGMLPKASEAENEEDFEDGFALPDELTQLSLAPLTLSHRASRESWGEKDQTSSSQSSDAYSTLGLADGASSSSATSLSVGSTDDDDDGDDDDLDGLVIPAGVFDRGEGAARHLQKTLELRQKPVASRAASTGQDDFEQDLIFDDEVDLSPSRLLHKQRAQRPPSRLVKPERGKSPTHPPPSASARQLTRMRLSPSPSFQAAGSLRGQKSHSGLKPPSPPSSSRAIRRKASLSSLMEISPAPSPTAPTQNPARYDAPTAASRARHKASSTRLASKEYVVPPTRPSTPASNPAALRLTLPTQGRVPKTRPALATVFGATARTNSPQPPPRPPSASSSRLPKPRSPLAAPKILRKPKRARTFGDGTELDGFDDLPTDMGKESRFRVQPKEFGHRVVGGTYSSKPPDLNKTTLRRKPRREVSSGTPTPTAGSSVTSLRQTATKPEPTFKPSPQKKKKLNPNHTKRKPTLIRNLGGAPTEKVVGSMKWNPQNLRWEGNEQVLRDFDAAVGTSSRPALITHLTGSSIGSPVSTFASGARLVGNMMFDPARMCWISTLPPEDEEPDVFANLADDESDESWERQAGTIRATVHTTTSSTGAEDTVSRSPNSSTSSSSIAAAQARSRAVSVSGSDVDRGSRASLAFDVDEGFAETCRAAAVRHRQEMKGWRSTLNKRTPVPLASISERTNLYEIRAIARRNYED